MTPRRDRRAVSGTTWMSKSTCCGGAPCRRHGRAQAALSDPPTADTRKLSLWCICAWMSLQFLPAQKLIWVVVRSLAFQPQHPELKPVHIPLQRSYAFEGRVQRMSSFGIEV